MKKRGKTIDEKTTKVKKKGKLKKKNIVILIITVVCFIVLGFSGYHIVRYIKDTKETNDILDDINSTVEVDDVYSDEEMSIYQDVEEPDDSPYWSYMKMSLIDVDFNELESINSDTKGWIQVPGTNINYPFAQAGDNEFYLTHTFNKSWNGNGWVFLDYRNDINNLGRNTIIYAHGLKNKTMFGTLRNVLKESWYGNTDNYVIKLSTKTQNSLWQVFSAYHIPTTTDYLQVNFGSDSQYKDFLNTMISRSMINFGTTVSENDKILTLSSCWSDDEKVVMHAKLIKYANR